MLVGLQPVMAIQMALNLQAMLLYPPAGGGGPPDISPGEIYTATLTLATCFADQHNWVLTIRRRRFHLRVIQRRNMARWRRFSLRWYDEEKRN